MFAVEVYAAVRHFVFVKGNSRREAARVFGLSRETVLEMCRFSLPPGYPQLFHAPLVGKEQVIVPPFTRAMLNRISHSRRATRQLSLTYSTTAAFPEV